MLELPPVLGAPFAFTPLAMRASLQLLSQVVHLGDLTTISSVPVTAQTGVANALIRAYSCTFIQQLGADTFTVNPQLRCGFKGKIAQQFGDAQCSNAANRFLIFDAGANSNFNGGAGVELRGLDLVIWGSADATYTGPAHGNVIAIVSYAILPAV